MEELRLGKIGDWRGLGFKLEQELWLELDRVRAGAGLGLVRSGAEKGLGELELGFEL